ncbi:MAG: polysaccharide deacetylase family protein [Haloarculaceae archaeon]
MGSVVFSVDAELGWGFHDVEAPPERLAAARRGWTTLLDLFDEYDVPATWAVVGHLLLTACDGRHEDHPAGPAWFARERGEWRDRPDLRFGPDLVDAVTDAEAGHELACHTFSHVTFGAETTERVARAELERCLALADGWKSRMRSFVFPRNSVGHRGLLAEYGFDAYRGVGPAGPSRTGKVAAALRRPAPRLVTPAVDEFGLVNVPASLYLYGFQGVARRVVTTALSDPMLEYARAGVDAAAEGDGVFHVWLHPNDLVEPADVARLESVLERVERRRGDLAVETMGEVATRVIRRPDSRSAVPDGDRSFGDSPASDA